MFPVENPYLWLLIVAAPACFISAWTDLRSMLIRNSTVLYLVAAFVVVGIFILPFGEFAWRILFGLIALVITYTLNQIGRMGGGDAKMIAAMVPYFSPYEKDVSVALFLASSTFLAALAVQRLAGRVPAIRRLTPEWKSWDHPGFPMGLALGATLAFYLAGMALLRHYGVL